MKKTILIVIALFCATILHARTQEEAKRLAEKFFAERATVSTQAKSKRISAIPTAELAFTQYQVDSTTPAVYIFNDGDQEGFVLVSAEDGARDVLGYSDHGIIHADDMPENFQFWLQMYADELARIKTPVHRAGQSTLQRPQRAATSNDYPTIAPILGDVMWGQGEPYNNLCPVVNGQRTPAGCVATAIGQIMYHHKHPEQGTGSHSYISRTNNIMLSADFGATTYDWGNMLPSYTHSNNPIKEQAVATLLSHVGIAADMNYTTSGSGSVGSTLVLNALVEHFGYDESYQVLPKDYLKESTILQQMAYELDLYERPIYMEGVTMNNEGHAFVCDGMQSNGFLHINWGWTGTANGYFAISALDPKNQGTGGSASDLAFTRSVMSYTGIRPNEGGQGTVCLTADALYRTCANEIKTNDPIKFEIDILSNIGGFDADGMLVLHIMNEHDQLAESIDCTSFSLRAGYYYKSYSLASKTPVHLGNGNYEMEILYRTSDHTTAPILVAGKGAVRIPLTVTDNIIRFGEMEEEQDGKAMSAGDFTNISYSKQWFIDIYSANFWSTSPYDDEVLIRCYINSGSNNSVIGTYVLDPSNSGQPGTIDAANALYAVGYSSACYQYEIEDLHLTITEAEDGKLQIQYYLKANNQVYERKYTIQPAWYLYQDDTYYYYDEYINYSLASTLSSSQAKALASSLSHNNDTKMAYFAHGIIAKLHTTAAEIAANKSATFDISDNGSVYNTFYCQNVRWLNNTDYVTGNEIAEGDEVVIYGPLMNNPSPFDDTPTQRIKGYIYDLKAGPGAIDYSIQRLELVSVEELKVTFEWESKAEMVELRAYDSKNKQIAKSYSTNKRITFTAPKEDVYTIHVRPVDNAHNYLAEEATLTVNVFITAVDDIVGTEMLYLHDLMGRLIDSKLSNDNRAWNIPAKGLYVIKSNNCTEKVLLHDM